MRRALRFILAGSITAAVYAGSQLLLQEIGGSIEFTLLFAAAGVLVLGCSWIFLYREHRPVFWVGSFLFTAFMAFAWIGGVGAYVSFFEKITVTYVLNVATASNLVFWYWVATLIIKPTRDEELRTKETLSQTELRHAQEKRTEEMKEIEREHFERMLDSMPENERIALLKKQKDYEEHLKKKGG